MASTMAMRLSQWWSLFPLHVLCFAFIVVCWGSRTGCRLVAARGCGKQLLFGNPVMLVCSFLCVIKDTTVDVDSPSPASVGARRAMEVRDETKPIHCRKRKGKEE